MKKLMAAILALMLLTAGALAESGVPSLNDQLFQDAKDALVMFESGDYSSAAELLGFADAAELEKFITGNYKTFGSGVQTAVSVAWYNGSSWLLAVPLYEPASPDVETLVLTTVSTDASAFCGYMYAPWSDVEAALAECDYVIWNEEYTSADSVKIFQDN